MVTPKKNESELDFEEKRTNKHYFKSLLYILLVTKELNHTYALIEERERERERGRKENIGRTEFKRVLIEAIILFKCLLRLF
jgi:hypothetical protein